MVRRDAMNVEAAFAANRKPGGVFSYKRPKEWNSIRRIGCFPAEGAYMLRTRRTGNGQVLFTLSGRIETEDVQQLHQLLAVETSGQQVILDLKDVTLVNQDAVKFLCRCEADGITLENCPLHVRQWIDQMRGRPGRRE